MDWELPLACPLLVAMSSFSDCSSVGSLCRNEDRSVSSERLSRSACSAADGKFRAPENCSGSTWKQIMSLRFFRPEEKVEGANVGQWFNRHYLIFVHYWGLLQNNRKQQYSRWRRNRQYKKHSVQNTIKQLQKKGPQLHNKSEKKGKNVETQIKRST